MKFTLILLMNFLYAPILFAATPGVPAAAHSVKIDGVEIDIVMQAPHLMVTPLQVFGTFQYEDKNDGFSGADLEMDEGFHGAIQELRKKNHFGRLAESLLLTAPKNGTVIPAKVLVMGLGKVGIFKGEDMEAVGSEGIRQACSLGLTEFSHASDVQDGGVSRVNAGVIAEHVVRGMIQEIRLQKTLVLQGYQPACNLTKVYYLAGPKFIKDTVASLDRTAKELSTAGK